MAFPPIVEANVGLSLRSLRVNGGVRRGVQPVLQQTLLIVARLNCSDEWYVMLKVFFHLFCWGKITAVAEYCFILAAHDIL